MEKFNGQLIIVTKSEFVGIATSEDEARDALVEFLDNLSRDGRDAEQWMKDNGNDLEVYATVSKSWTPEFIARPGELDLDELEENEPETYEIEVTSTGYLYGETFDTEDDLTSRVKEAYTDGDMDIDDIQNMEVRRTLYENTSFYSVEEGEREVVYGYSAADAEREMRQHTESQYVRFDDLEAHLGKMVEEQVAKHQALSADTAVPVPPSEEESPDQLGAEDIQRELMEIEEKLDKLNHRKYVLKQELAQRGTNELDF